MLCDFYIVLIISASLMAWFLNLVFLRRRHRASRVARVSNRVILDLVSLLSQMESRVEETSVAREYSVRSSTLESSRRRRGCCHGRNICLHSLQYRLSNPIVVAALYKSMLDILIRLVITVGTSGSGCWCEVVESLPGD